MMNLVLGTLWLGAAIAGLGYELISGDSLMRIRFLNISSGWLLLLLAVWNFARYYSARAGRADREALRIAHEERLRNARYRERPSEPDATFDFSDKPAPPPPQRNLSDRPPSNN